MRVANLITDYTVISSRDDTLRQLLSPGFIPTFRVLLESEPPIRPEHSSDPGTVSVSNQTTDSLEIQAELKTPAILLVSNSYSRGWRAVPLEGSPQASYDIMPANWTLQAIPLSAGKHHLRVEYAPAAFRIGAWISAISLLAYVAAVAVQLRTRNRRVETTVFR